MRDNSGKGKATNNNLNPTLDEHQEAKEKQPQNIRTEQSDDIVGNARRRGEDPSPDDRERGETSVAD